MRLQAGKEYKLKRSAAFYGSYNNEYALQGSFIYFDLIVDNTAWFKQRNRTIAIALNDNNLDKYIEEINEDRIQGHWHYGQITDGTVGIPRVGYHTKGAYTSIQAMTSFKEMLSFQDISNIYLSKKEFIDL